MSSVNVSPVPRSRTTTRAVPCRQAKRSSWPRSWKWRPRITPWRENETFVCTVGFGRMLSRRSSQNQPRSSSKRSSGIRTMPSTLTWGYSLVHACLVDRAADLGEVLPVLARVLPPAAHRHDGERTALGVRAVHIGDLELAAARALEARDHGEDVGRIAVEPDHGIVRGRRRVA